MIYYNQKLFFSFALNFVYGTGYVCSAQHWLSYIFVRDFFSVFFFVLYIKLHYIKFRNFLETDLDMPVDRIPSQFCDEFGKPIDLKFSIRRDWEESNIPYEEDAMIFFPVVDWKFTFVRITKPHKDYAIIQNIFHHLDTEYCGITIPLVFNQKSLGALCWILILCT